MLQKALAGQKRVLSPDAEPEKGHFYRSDHFSLAKVGIPAISPTSGRNLVVGGPAAGQKLMDDYETNRYHQPSDEWRANWDLSGPIRDLDVFYRAGRMLADSDAWPNYYRGSEFRALRDKARAAKN